MATLTPSREKEDITRCCYPERFVETFGHARTSMLLHCCDQAMEDPEFRAAHSVLYSTYHALTGAKFAVGCTPFGTDGYPSSISDSNIVLASWDDQDLRFGDVEGVHKAFLIECICALLGIGAIRLTTMRDNQRQQSAGDTEKHQTDQTIGITRIVIE
eukprot:CAMPEP_0194033534 /NCGR_PEP_ID=MMETSP0009_2-20130614/6194_1 /TAXON_ID=210454 /ORGANISM="Grammatophora oceanica, Strain CCMP 410" /LENGTH=157 /DNA_ID=CAMNT_0038674247 /DNA_START=347 /DNA_END=819 /DNA_ORIENTATION=-